MNSGTKVLLVEDEATLAVIIRDTLKSQDFQVTTADNGEQGLQLFFREHPDLVVADVMMPNMDGYEMVRRIRSKDVVTYQLPRGSLPCSHRRVGKGIYLHILQR